MTLPTLPIPAMKPFVIGDCYTTEQMLQFQRDTVEACAKAVLEYRHPPETKLFSDTRMNFVSAIKELLK